ncbi:uncharacterized protein LOC131171225 [Hevea brasiliensis]|uniref:uncharacterized protein LOC131171225 n=1 Tax=Hevea brasiliensis TaxID=3981 RepID=UPI0025F7E038|nr:uncharacterized protein LOC131171225 [Hevea brasiliensis]
MEEAIPVQDPPTQDPNPNPLATNPTPLSQPPQVTVNATPPPPATVVLASPSPSQQPPPPPPLAAASLPPKGKKKALDGYVQIQYCSYFKMRVVLKDIRSHLLELHLIIHFHFLTPKEQIQEVKPADQPQSNRVLAKPYKSKEAIDLKEQSCCIGGFAFCWNFITFLGTKPVYYGRTKESFWAT